MEKNTKKIMDEIRQFAAENFVPIVREETQKHLVQTIQNVKPKQILEIGTAIGYSGILMLSNCEEGTHLTTIELIEKRFEKAKQNFEKVGFASQVTQIFDDAFKAISQQKENSFDFIFLDGPKGQYANYLPILKKLLKPNGVLFADDVLYRGMVLSDEYPKHKERRIVLGLRAFLQNLMQDNDFETKLFEIEDGFTISKKIK
ncbi:MAG: O-methyltransferase [Christensenellales bacterium]|jgi:predicted O-methyltransferase YrrM